MQCKICYYNGKLSGFSRLQLFLLADVFGWQLNLCFVCCTFLVLECEKRM